MLDFNFTRVGTRQEYCSPDCLKINTTKTVQLNKVEFSANSNNNLYFIESDVLYKLDESLNLSSTIFFKDNKIELKQLYFNDHKIYVVSKYNDSKQIYVFNEDLKHLYNITIKNPNLYKA